MILNLEKTKIRGCYIVKTKRFGDNRGWFMETISQKDLEAVGLPSKFLQGNLSMSEKAKTFRGMHYQSGDAVQGKLVNCIKGKVIDYIFDARVGSPTYMQNVAVELDGDSMEPSLVYVPEGCLHGFYVDVAPAYFSYFVTNYYNQSRDGGVLGTDEHLGLDLSKQDFILSDKDKILPKWNEANLEFTYSPRILVTGALQGQLGPDVVKELKKRGYRDIYAVDKEILDLTDSKKINELVNQYEPDIIFHCAAFTQVDLAQKNEELARKINSEATKYLTEAAIHNNAKLIYISTDYVFDGTKDGLYEIDDIPNPQSVYGKTKLEGEQYALEHNKTFIVRTSWIFGGLTTNNFVKTMLNLKDKLKEITVVNDQIGSPTYSKDLAKFLVDLSETEKYGIYHGNNAGYCSWYDFAKKIFEYANSDIKVLPVTTEEYYGTEQNIAKIKAALKEMKEEVNDKLTQEQIDKIIAPRPRNSKLNKDVIVNNGFNQFRNWEDALEEYMTILKINE